MFSSLRVACLSGWLYVHFQRAVNPTPFGLSHGIEYLFMDVAGGAAHVRGAILGATLLTVLNDSLQGVLPQLLGSYGNVEIIVFGVQLLIFLQDARDGRWPFVRRLCCARGRFPGCPGKGRRWRGMCLEPEKRELFASMSVEDNLRLGAYQRRKAGERNHLDQMEPVFELFPCLRERRGQAAGTLSGGE